MAFNFKNINARKLVFALIILGLIDTVYLTYIHYVPKALICPTLGIINCASVVTSSFSVIIGIPLAIYGLIWFIVQMFLFFINNYDIKFFWNIIGLLGVTYSVSAMFLLGKICEYCTVLDILIILIAVLFFIASKKH